MLEHDYGTMLRVEETLTCYLSLEAAWSLKALTLSTKPNRTTSSLMGKVNMAMGHLHTMAILQAFQADLLRDLDEGEGVGTSAIKELQATKETVHIIGRSMSALVATERHLWPKLSRIKVNDK